MSELDHIVSTVRAAKRGAPGEETALTEAVKADMLEVWVPLRGGKSHHTLMLGPTIAGMAVILMERQAGMPGTTNDGDEGQDAGNA